MRRAVVLAAVLLVNLACPPARVRVREPGSLVRGNVAPGFEEVREEFLRNFTERGEYGAACCVWWRGEKVVDLWGGYADIRARRPWQQHTCVMVFSTTKGMSALALALCHSRGWLDYDAPVARYWPEFAANGKAEITVRQLLGHQAGLPAPDRRLTISDIENLDALAEVLARQRPLWPPGTRQGYHLASLGLYENELLRRVDPLGRTLGRFFAEEVAAPLGIRFYIGLPDTVPDERLATIYRTSLVKAALTRPLSEDLGMLRPRALLHRATRIPADADPNSRRTRAIEQPSYNGIGEVRAVARVYSEFATGGRTLGLDSATLAELAGPPGLPDSGRVDFVLHEPSWFRLGLFKPGRDFWFGSTIRSYGHPGLGGSMGFADPDLGLGFAYAPNRLGMNRDSGARRRALAAAAYRCVERALGR
ncbi:beta-lactamase family protein [candidate division WOR-3 bacterium]|nr:beta-lactamase family protein [candidate division WOR-3 bacterium]